MTRTSLRTTPPPVDGRGADVRRLPSCPGGTRIAEAIRILDEVQQAIPADETQARSAVLRLRVLLADPATERPLPCRGGLAPWQQRKVEHHMRTGLDRVLRLSDLAREASLSVSYFSRAFRKSFGLTPHQHLIWLRVERAQQLMRTTDAPLMHIALDCGLADQAHLSKIFRRLTGETPSGWRRRHAPGTRPDLLHGDAADEVDRRVQIPLGKARPSPNLAFT